LGDSRNGLSRSEDVFKKKKKKKIAVLFCSFEFRFGVDSFEEICSNG